MVSSGRVVSSVVVVVVLVVVEVVVEVVLVLVLVVLVLVLVVLVLVLVLLSDVVEDGNELLRIELVSKELNQFGGDRVVFPRLGTRYTDRWQINKGLCATCQCPRCPISKKQRDPPKVI